MHIAAENKKPEVLKHLQETVAGKNDCVAVLCERERQGARTAGKMERLKALHEETFIAHKPI